MNLTLKSLKVVPYNPKWVSLFEQEADLIRRTLGEHCLDIYHVGSTSVPGLEAKPDLDILCIVDGLLSSLRLCDSGYLFKGEINLLFRNFFSKNSLESRVNLHVVESGHGFIALSLKFRDYLKTHETVRLAYAALKRQLLQDASAYEERRGGFTGYTLGKNEFIKDVLAKAGFDGFCANFCLHDSEWEAYHRIRTKELFDPLGISYDRKHPSLSAKNHYHIVLYKGVKIVAVAHVELLGSFEAALRSLATDEPYQRRGYGIYLMKLLEKWLRYHGIKVIKFHARPSAVAFYRRLGYVSMSFEDLCIQPDYVDLGKML